MAIYQLDDKRPQLAPGAWVAETASVIGQVVLEEGANVWYGAVVRGDNDLIHLGRNSNVQDGCVLHTDGGIPLRLADHVSIGHQVMLHGCEIGERSLVGIQAVVLNHARIGKRCIVAAGAVVTEGKEFPDESLIVGAPARRVSGLKPQHLLLLERIAEHYVALAARHRSGLRRID